MLSAFTPIGGLTQNRALIDVIGDLGLTSGLQLCLDAGDSRSYDGSSQTWTDQSGGGYSFFRGTTSSSEASDPTFNGTSGRLSGNEYFSVDGGDWFTLNQSNPSWVTSFHKAGAKFTTALWTYGNAIAAGNVRYGMIGTTGTAGSITGFAMGGSSTPLRYVVSINNASTQIYQRTSTGSINNNAWNFVAVSFDVTSGNVYIQLNGSTETYTSQTFSGTPDSGADNSTIQIDALGNGGTASVTGCRTATCAMWNTGLTGAQLLSIYSAMRGRFGV